MARVLTKNKQKVAPFKKDSKVTKASALSITLAVILILYCIVIFALLIWGLNTSLKTSQDYLLLNNKIGLPRDWSKIFDNYVNILKAFSYRGDDKSYISAIFGRISDVPTSDFTFGTFLTNSFVYCIIGSLAKTFVAMLCGYLVAKYKYKFSKAIYVMMLVVLAIPIVGSAPSMLKLTQDLAIYDSYIGMLILNLNFTGVYFFVFVAYFGSYSDVYLEAAEIDGANQFKSFFKIVFPMAAKIFATVFLLNFITLWNDYQTPLLYYPNHPTLSYGVYKMYTYSAQHLPFAMELPQKIAGCMLLVIPVLILFLATKKALLGNMSAGGIKE